MSQRGQGGRGPVTLHSDDAGTADPSEVRGSALTSNQHTAAHEERGDTGGFTATRQAVLSASTPRSGDELDPHHQGTQIDGTADSQGTEVDLAQSQQSSPYSLANSSSDTPERDTIQDLDYTKYQVYNHRHGLC